MTLPCEHKFLSYDPLEKFTEFLHDDPKQPISLVRCSWQLSKKMVALTNDLTCGFPVGVVMGLFWELFIIYIRQGAAEEFRMDGKAFWSNTENNQSFHVAQQEADEDLDRVIH